MTSNAQALEVRKQLSLTSAVERVWQALTDPTQLGQWFPDRVHAETLAEGTRGWFEWDKHGRYAFEVEEMDPPRRLVWRWARDPNKDLDDTPTTRVEWTLEPSPAGGTNLTLVETGFSADKYRQENDQGWDQELGHLTELLGR